MHHYSTHIDTKYRHMARLRREAPLAPNLAPTPHRIPRIQTAPAQRLRRRRPTQGQRRKYFPQHRPQRPRSRTHTKPHHPHPRHRSRKRYIHTSHPSLPIPPPRPQHQESMPRRPPPAGETLHIRRMGRIHAAYSVDDAGAAGSRFGYCD